MTEYELDKICERQTDCDCKCMKCQIFAMYQRSQLGYNESHEDDDY